MVGNLNGRVHGKALCKYNGEVFHAEGTLFAPNKDPVAEERPWLSYSPDGSFDTYGPSTVLGAGDTKMKSLGLCPEGLPAGNGHAILQLQSSVRSASKGRIEDAMRGPLDLGMELWETSRSRDF